MNDLDARPRVLRIALVEVDHGDPSGAKYWREMSFTPPFPKHWCGAFVLWTLHAAGLGLDMQWTIGRGFLWDSQRNRFRLPTTKNPEPGDVAYFDKHQHHALVLSREGDRVVTIDGNQPGFAVRERRLGDAAGYFSIAPLIPHTTEAPAAVATRDDSDGSGRWGLVALGLAFAWGVSV